jgi:hypothetical protein
MAKPSFLRRLLLCPMGLCAFSPQSDDKACWGECTICNRRSGEVSRKAIRSYMERTAPLPACTIAPSLDDLHPAFSEPVTGYMSRTGYELLHVRSGWWTKFCLDRGELNPRGGVVEVEVRLRRVIEP